MAERPAQPPAQAQQTVALERHYPVAPEKVWRAWTDPKALSRWFGPGEPDSVTRAELDVRPGGRYTVAFRTQDGEEHCVSGIYEEVLINRRLVLSWAWQSTPDRVSRVRIELRPNGAGTDMSFRHDRFFDQAARDGHERGWVATFAKLEDLLAA